MILAERDMAMVREIGKRMGVLGGEVVLGCSNAGLWVYQLPGLSSTPLKRPVLNRQVGRETECGEGGFAGDGGGRRE